jgi:hypothetical protein
LSSILDALRKLEAESPDPSSNGAWQQPAEGPKTVYPRIKNIHRIPPMGLILSGIALLLILFAIFGLAWFRHPQPKPVSSSGPADPTPGRKAAVSSNQTAQKASPLIKASPSSSVPVEGGHLKIGSTPATKASPNIAPGITPKKKQQANFKPPVSESGHQAPLDKVKTGKPQPAKTVIRRPLASQTPRQPLTDEPKTTTIPSPLKVQIPTPAAPDIAIKPYQGHTPIKLQAIAWSDNPTQRLAVINNTIAREGQWIGDILLVRIQPDKIIFQKGSERWELRFRHQ